MKNKDYKTKILQIKVSIEGTKPLVWRRVLVPATMSLRGLHRLIQSIFFWQSYHLYLYTVDGNEYGNPELDEGEFGWCNDQSKKLIQIYKKTDRFSYLYDFGDNWNHLIQIEKLIDAEPDIHYPLWIDGENGPIREDSGGVHSYNQKHKKENQVGVLPVPRILDGYDHEEINELVIPRRKVLVEKSSLGN